ncbi:hypothetical protein pb186bvf_000534 [Paramecium bursaria]
MSFIIYLLFFAFAKILILTDQNYTSTVKSYPYFLFISYSKQCKHCKHLLPEIKAVEQYIRKPEIGIGILNVQKYPESAAQMNALKTPTIYFYRLGDRELYNGPRDRYSLLNFLNENSRQLLHIINDKQYFDDFVKDKTCLIYFEGLGLSPDLETISKMKQISKKYKSIYSIHVQNPHILDKQQLELRINSDIKIINETVYDLEKYLFHEVIPLIFHATDIEMHIFLTQRISGLITIQEDDDKYEELAQKLKGFVRIILISPENDKKIEFFMQLLRIDEFKYGQIFYYNFDTAIQLEPENIEDYIYKQLDKGKTAKN